MKNFKPEVGRRYLFCSHDGNLFEITVLEVTKTAIKISRNGGEFWEPTEYFVNRPTEYWRESRLVETLTPPQASHQIPKMTHPFEIANETAQIAEQFQQE
jgi:hypothetical protein